MFKRLTVKNYQAHRHTVFEFSPRITAILGDSDSGKTAGFIRALRLLTDNRPLTPDYFSDFAGKDGWTEVELVVVDDGVEQSVAIRKHIKVQTKNGKRTKKTVSEDSQYIINGGEPLSGFASTVPEDVKRIINLSDAAIQEQEDPAYFISFSPGEATKVINRTARLENIDDWRLRFSKRQNQASAATKVLKRDIEDIEGKLKQLIGATFLKRDMDQLDEIDFDIQGVQTEIKDIANLMVDYEKTSKWLTAENELKQIEKLYSEAVSVNERIEEAQEELDLLQGYFAMRERLRGLTARQIDLASEYAGLMRASGLCPLCFSSIDDKTIKRISKEILKG